MVLCFIGDVDYFLLAVFRRTTPYLEVHQSRTDERGGALNVNVRNYCCRISCLEVSVLVKPHPCTRGISSRTLLLQGMLPSPQRRA